MRAPRAKVSREQKRRSGLGAAAEAPVLARWTHRGAMPPRLTWEGLVYNALLSVRYRCLAIGPGRPCLRAIGGLQIISGAIFPRGCSSAKRASPLILSWLLWAS